MMYDHEKSDSAIVAVKPTNKAGQPAAEPVEPRVEQRKKASPSNTRGGSRAELGPLGSVRGALSNERPYRDLRNVVANYPFERSHRFAGIQPKLASETIRV